MIKKFEITVRGEDCITKRKIIWAKDKEEAKELGWELFPEYDSIYVEEVK